MDDVIRISRDAFLAYEPIPPPFLQAAVERIEAFECFTKTLCPETKKPIVSKWTRGDRWSGSDSGHRSKNHKRRGANGRQRPQRSSPSVFNRPRPFATGVPESHKIVIDTVNKLSDRSYNAVSNRLLRGVTSDNAHFAVRYIMENAYDQIERGFLFLRLINDMISAAQSDEFRDIYVQGVDEQINASVSKRIEYPAVDAAKNYEQFCEVTKRKKRDVGMCDVIANSFHKLDITPSVTRDDLYDHYENMMKRVVTSGTDEFDVAGTCETLVECLHVILMKDVRRLMARFRESFGDESRFPMPSKRSQFLVRDILGH